MSQILNKDERQKAFLKFLLFFLVTIGLVAGAIYFDFRVPVEQNKMLLKANSAQNLADDSQHEFVARMETVARLLDTTNIEGLTSTQINEGINELRKREKNSNPLYERMNTVLIREFMALQAEKSITRKLSEENERLSKKLTDCKEDLENERSKNSGNASYPEEY